MLSHYIRVPIAEFGAEFGKFQQEAFRLEAVQTFDVPDERVPIALFQKSPDAPAPADFNVGWHEIIQAAAKRGADMKRLRIAIRPYAPYLRFETRWGYLRSASAGERIYVLSVNDFSEVPVPHDLLKDFWLFDELHAYIIDYDLRGRFLGAWKADEALTKMLIETKQKLLASAVPLAESELMTR